MGKVLSDSFYNHIIEPAWANCFPSLLPQFPQLFKMGLIFTCCLREVGAKPSAWASLGSDAVEKQGTFGTQ